MQTVMSRPFAAPGLTPRSSEQLVEEVIGGIKPEVVMVELDADRICLLPPGEAMEVGLPVSLV